VQIQAILLAAGASRRFGSNKLLASLDGSCLAGEPLVVRAARNLRGAAAPVTCVVRDPVGPVANVLARIPGVAICACSEAHLGMGRSLACGVAASAWADAWLVALGDMPEVNPNTIRRLMDALRSKASIVAPVFAGRRGHPVGFSRHWYPQLLALEGDQGARGLLAEHRSALRLVPVTDPGVLRDFDRPTDCAGAG
jgi:molybdenum cofactor cytidylyltransferase